MARYIVVNPAPQLALVDGAGRSNRWPSARSFAAAAAFGSMLWYGAGSLDLPAPPNREAVSQPTAARALAQPTRVLPGLSSESLDKSATGTPSQTRAERAERRKARKEAARAKREAARELRASTAQERREASEAKHAAARERYAAAKQARLEAAEERSQASKAKHEAAHERYAAATQARREAAEERRQATDAKHDAARERHAAAKQARIDAAEARRDAARQKRELARAGSESRAGQDMPDSTSFGSSAPLASDAALGSAGVLRVNSLPWAQVFIDGRMVGYTPQRSISVTPGDHDVRLVNPVFAMSKSLHVRIAQGQQVTRSEILEE